MSVNGNFVNFDELQAELDNVSGQIKSIRQKKGTKKKTQLLVASTDANGNVNGIVDPKSGATCTTMVNTLYQGGVPIIYPMSGSIAANGALSGVTFDIVYANCYIYLPAGAVYVSSPAGLYYCKMSSTTAGVVYLNYLNAGNAPNIIDSPTPVTAGQGAYTTLTSQIALMTYAIPANSLNKNGILEIEHEWQTVNNANAKNILIQFGGQSVLGSSIASKVSMQSLEMIRYKGDGLNWTAFNQGGATYTTSTSTIIQRQTDNTVAQTLVLNVTMAVATDFIVLAGVRVTARPFS